MRARHSVLARCSGGFERPKAIFIGTRARTVASRSQACPREPKRPKIIFAAASRRIIGPLNMPANLRVRDTWLFLTVIIGIATISSPAFAHGWHCHPAWDPGTTWHRHWQACGPNWGHPGWPRSGPARRAGFRCPPPGNINCMPPVRPERRNLCRPEFIDWARRHCPGFHVVY